jgi:hypothetical protein
MPAFVRIISRIIGTGLLALGFMLSATLSSSATTPIHAAGIVVDYGNGAMSYAWVPFSADHLNGVELLEQSGLPVLTVGFGGLGDAVCRIQETGCDVSACRTRLCQTAAADSPFWHYFRLSANGTWTTQALGASGSVVRDGDVDAWVWTGKLSLPAVPPLTLSGIVARTGANPTAANAKPVSITTGEIGDAMVRSTWPEYMAAGAIILALCAASAFSYLRVRHRVPVPR